MMKLLFIYELSYNGVIFYVGSTDRPCARYVDHRNGTNATSPIINAILAEGKTFDFKIVNIFEDVEQTYRREMNLIGLYAKLKIGLFNIDGNPKENQITFFHPRTRKPRTTHIKIKKYVDHVIEEYKAGKFRYECLGYTASIGRRIGYPRSKCS
jgi:predicted GIY-YIG superfamily endonuclease